MGSQRDTTEVTECEHKGNKHREKINRFRQVGNFSAYSSRFYFSTFVLEIFEIFPKTFYPNVLYFTCTWKHIVPTPASKGKI